ncbi:MAG: hypothetical protein SchgKO_18230 [Schleiferiaceae bacterium]
MKLINGRIRTGSSVFTIALGLAFTVASCNQPTEAPSAEESNAKNQKAQTEITADEGSFNVTNRKIRRTTFMLWQVGYNYFINNRQEDNNVYLNNNYNELEISNEEITKISELFPNCPGIRTYFGASDPSNTIYNPCIMFVGVNEEGNDVLPNDTLAILFYDENLGESNIAYVDSTTAYSYKSQWNSFKTIRNRKNPAFFPIDAYTFNFSELKTLANDSSLYAVFGYTPVGSDPAYSNAYTPESNCGVTNQGGINALKIAFSRYTTASILKSDECDFLDFANPCPQYCGNGLFD